MLLGPSRAWAEHLRAIGWQDAVASATISRNPRSCWRSDAELRRRDRDLGETPVSGERHVHGPADQAADEGPLKIADAGDRAAVERDEEVARSQPGVGRR